MIRYVVTSAMFLVIFCWLLLSYMPQVAGRLPQLSLNGEIGTGLLPLLTALTLLVFLVLQAELVGATIRMFRCRRNSVEGEAIALFRLTRGREVFWTIVPLLSTVALVGWLWAARP